MSRVADKVYAEAESAASKHACSLWDVEFVREAGRQVLRLYIDKEGGVGINDCEAVSRTFEHWLDETDPIPDSYTLEVSSAGLTRALKRPGDFPRFIGHRVDVRFYKPENGIRELTGVLIGRNDQNLTVAIEGIEQSFPVKNVSLVKLNPLL